MSVDFFYLLLQREGEEGPDHLFFVCNVLSLNQYLKVNANFKSANWVSQAQPPPPPQLHANSSLTSLYDLLAASTVAKAVSYG